MPINSSYCARSLSISQSIYLSICLRGRLFGISLYFCFVQHTYTHTHRHNDKIYIYISIQHNDDDDVSLSHTLTDKLEFWFDSLIWPFILLVYCYTHVSLLLKLYAAQWHAMKKKKCVFRVPAMIFDFSSLHLDSCYLFRAYSKYWFLFVVSVLNVPLYW